MWAHCSHKLKTETIKIRLSKKEKRILLSALKKQTVTISDFFRRQIAALLK